MDHNQTRRLEVLPTDEDDITSLTLVLKDEDHTLGNALRYVIMKNPDVKVCGYGVPHPSEHKINLRIQTYGVPASDVFQKGLEDLQKMCDIVTQKFKKAQEAYEETKEENQMSQGIEAMNADD